MVDTKSPQSQRLLNHFPLSRVVSTWYVPPSETPKTRRYFRGPLMQAPQAWKASVQAAMEARAWTRTRSWSSCCSG